MTRRRWPFVAVLLVGAGLAVAPVAFQMFTRAPKGGDMLAGFGPYMSPHELDSFTADLATIDAAHHQAVALAQANPSSSAATSSGAVAFEQQWPSIDADMTSMLGTMRANVGRYDGVAALPSFVLFPWFFVIPGVVLVALGVWALRRPERRVRVVIGAIGVGLLLAPAAFQMFSRAPGGARMIDDFKPFMTPAKVRQIQGYFLTIGNGEGDLRLRVVPDLEASGRASAANTSAITTLSRDWPAISSDMAPMIGAMVDNLDNFDAVAALPPFWLFPWFFVIPGIAVIGLALVARQTSAVADDSASAPSLTVLQGARS